MPRTLTTERLEIRLPVEADRSRFVELFANAHFMAFSGGTLGLEAANARFDRMLRVAAEVPFAKQPVIERSSGVILGYSGVGRFEFEGEDWLEYGYRLCLESRGQGYATEAGTAILELAAQTFEGTLLGMIDPTNEPSIRVIGKLGFRFWKQDKLDDGYVANLYRLNVGSGNEAEPRPQPHV